MAKKTNINELARRYTTAVFQLANSQNKLDAVSADLAKLQAQLDADKKITKFLGSPLLTPARQVEFVKSVAADLKVDALTLNMLLVVAKNGRLKNLGAIIAQFQSQVAEEKGQITAKIISATELKEDELKQVVAELGKKTGKQVIAQAEVDPAIIGGLIVKIGSSMYDYSVKTRLNRLAEQLKKAS